MSRRLFTLSSKRSASLALYGTLSLCTATSFLSLTTDYSLQQAYKSKNKKDFDAAIERKKLLVDHATCSMRNLSEGRVYTLITSAFNHGSPMHFLGNMLGLWSFGQAIAFGFGARAFISLFYGGALTGNLACLSLDYYRSPKVDNDRLNTTTAKPANRNYVGSSGGVCAIACASACFNPWGMMIVGISFIPVPIPNILFPFGFAAFSAFAEGNRLQENVAHLGHLGGLGYGFLWFLLKKRGVTFS